MAFWRTTLTVCLIIFGKSTAYLSMIEVHCGETLTLSCDSSATEVVYYRDVRGPRKTVAEFDKKHIKPGLGYEHRVTLHTNFTVTLRSLFNDNGYFECLNQKKDVLRDFQVVVRAPIAVGRAAYIGSSFHISFYGFTDFLKNDMLSNCSKDGQPMLAILRGEIFYEKEFENKVRVSKDAYQYGELRMTFPVLRSSDQGLYECSIEGVTPRAVILTATERQLSPWVYIAISGCCVSAVMAICFLITLNKTVCMKHLSKCFPKRTSRPVQETLPVYLNSHGPVNAPCSTEELLIVGE